MQWRLVQHPYGGWIIEYKNGILSGWQKVNEARHYQWEPSLPAVFKKKGRSFCRNGQAYK